MEYENPQFVGAVKKISSELLHDDLGHIADGIQKIKDSIDAKRESDNKRQERDKPVAVSDLRTKEAIRVKTESDYGKIKLLGRFIKGTLECVGILAVIAYTYLMLQSNEIAMSNFRRARIDANGQLKEAMAQTELTRKNFITDQRAWVGVDFPKLSSTWSADKKQITFTTDAIIKNTGKTPALNMSIFKGISFIRPWNQVLDYDKEWAANLAEKEREEKMMLKSLAQMQSLGKGTEREGAGAVLAYFVGTTTAEWKSHGLVMSPGATSPLDFLTNKTLPDPNQDPHYQKPVPQVIYWLGRITYTDIFSDKVHTTKICLRSAGRGLELCPDGGNSMD
jgi:hypothetical protein